MDIIKSAFGCYRPIFNLAELSLIKGYKAEEKIEFGSDQLPIGQLVANAVEWHKGVIIDGCVKYPTYQYVGVGADTASKQHFVKAGEICPSPVAKLIGCAIEVAYRGDLQVEETLHKVFQTIERFESHFDEPFADWKLFPFPPSQLVAYLWNEVGINKKITPLLIKEEDFRRLNR